jgi:phosphatidylinositol alpha-mannosyltransferase
MRVALVSPYSWTYPGGVTRHIEALAAQLGAAGHEVRVLAPFDADVRRAALLHRGARPQPRRVPEWLVPLVGTFHCYSEARRPHAIAVALGARRKLNRLAVRIAVSEAAAWTGRRFYGGRYRVVPNGVALPAGGVPAPRRRAQGEPLRIAFVGQAVERKGLSVLLRAFEALRREAPAELTVVGAGREEVAPLLLDPEGITVLGRIDDAARHAVVAASDVLCAPSLGGESFGMVLTEAFAAGTGVVASDIAGYRDVARDGEDAVLVPRGDATGLAEVLRDLAHDPARTEALGAAAAASAQRYAWPRIAEEVVEAYEAARAVPEPRGAPRRAAVRAGVVPADLGPPARARRLPSLEPERPAGRAAGALRRVAVGTAAAATAAGAAYALERIGLRPIGRALIDSQPVWVVAALALMCASMVLRAVSWHAILRAALPEARPRWFDAMQGTAIGVLMSATLPARLGEPSRALIVARRLGRPRDALPAVLGTLVSQTLLNVLALVILGAVMFATIGLFAGRQQALVWYALAPVVLAALVVAGPAVLRHGWVGRARAALRRVRSGLRVFRQPRLGLAAATAQLGAWAVQWIACYLLLVALGLESRADLGAAAAVLFAVNVTAVLPVTPSNIGVFQAACVAVLTGAYGVHAAQALGFGIILQAVEMATAVVMGAPALVKEGLSWREVRLRALHAAPVSLSRAGAAREAEA